MPKFLGESYVDIGRQWVGRLGNLHYFIARK